MIQSEEATEMVAYGDAHDDLDLYWLVRAGNALIFHRIALQPALANAGSWVKCTCEVEFEDETTWRQHVANEVMHAGFDDMEDYVHAVNEANGWHKDERHPLTGHMLIVTEVAEASEAHRSWGSDDMTGLAEPEKAKPAPDGSIMPKPLGAGSEYGDILVRLLDQTWRERGEGVKNLFFEFKRDVAYNKVRGFLHGNKRV